jgi:hypothetical protein
VCFADANEERAIGVRIGRLERGSDKRRITIEGIYIWMKINNEEKTEREIKETSTTYSISNHFGTSSFHIFRS